jgi:hypothetical protein
VASLLVSCDRSLAKILASRINSLATAFFEMEKCLATSYVNLIDPLTHLSPRQFFLVTPYKSSQIHYVPKRIVDYESLRQIKAVCFPEAKHPSISGWITAFVEGLGELSSRRHPWTMPTMSLSTPTPLSRAAGNQHSSTFCLILMAEEIRLSRP